MTYLSVKKKLFVYLNLINILLQFIMSVFLLFFFIVCGDERCYADLIPHQVFEWVTTQTVKTKPFKTKMKFCEPRNKIKKDDKREMLTTGGRRVPLLTGTLTPVPAGRSRDPSVPSGNLLN